MWTPENRPKYDRSRLRYPSDLTDEEWAIVAPLIPPAKRGGNKRTIDERAVVNGVMYILSTGCQWAAIAQGLDKVADQRGVRNRRLRSSGRERRRGRSGDWCCRIRRLAGVLACPACRLSDRHEGRDGRGQSGKGPHP